MLAATGDQYVISAGGYTATITQSGATLRTLTYDAGAGARALIDGFAEDAIPSGGRGQLLMPWPNRIRDGRYTFGGEEYQLPLSEASRHNASHGLVRWASWTPLQTTTDSISLGYRLMAQSGYPWTLDLVVTYELDDVAGLVVTQAATNRAAAPAPYASGAHPYLRVGDGPVDHWELELPAGIRLLSDPDRKLPAGREPVAGTAYDYRGGRAIGDTVLDHAFTDLTRDANGRTAVRLTGPDGGLKLWVDESHPWLMVYTGDDRPSPRRSVAVEPMTAPPDAFNSGEDLVTLQPGETFSAGWGLQALS